MTNYKASKIRLNEEVWSNKIGEIYTVKGIFEINRSVHFICQDKAGNYYRVGHKELQPLSRIGTQFIDKFREENNLK